MMSRHGHKKDKPRCLVTASLTDAALAKMAERLHVFHEDWRKTGRIYFGDDMADRIKRDDINFVIIEADQLTREAIMATDIKFIGVCRGNPYNIDLAAATEKGIPVVYTPGRNSQAVAEHTVGLALAILRNIVRAHRILAAGITYEGPADFQRMYNYLEGREISGKTVGIIGLGDIGTKVARIISCFGASILVYDPYAPNDRITSVGATKATLDELLRESDIVTIHARLTNETHHLIGEEEISKMKATAVIINTSAPGIVDDSALLKALREGRIAGAAIDVQENEPVDSLNPFLHLDNVVVTPHIAGNTTETIKRQSEMIVEDLFRFLDGKRPRYVMNPRIYSDSRN
jgi:D-3-phosphoglycerate dehydrogenase